jgi:hypothetical protein
VELIWLAIMITAENEIPAEDPAVFPEDEDPTELQSCEKGIECQVDKTVCPHDSAVFSSDTHIASDDEQPFSG